MAVDVVTEIVIEKPPAIVSAFAADPENAPKWYENIKSVEWVSSPGLRVGAKVAFIAHFLGRRLAYTYEFVELTPERLVMRTADGPFPMETSYTWSRAPSGGTIMRLRNRGAPSGFSILMQPLMSGAIRAANRKDLACLKALIEARA